MPDDKVTTTRFALPVPAVIVGIAVLLIGGVVAYLTFFAKPAAPPAPVLTQEAKDYIQYFKFSDVGLQAAESYINSSVVEILGKITNTGNRRVRNLQVYCVFQNVYDKPIYRELATIIGKSGPIGPGETKSFRLAFENPPAGWNRSMPAFVIAQIQFE